VVRILERKVFGPPSRGRLDAARVSPTRPHGRRDEHRAARRILLDRTPSVDARIEACGTLRALLEAGLVECVDVVVAFEDTDEHKPAARPQREALRHLRARAGVGVGDLPSDVASARAAGLAAIGVSWGYGTRGALLEAGAERVCDSAE
jgi:hypothetical protein